MKCDGCVFAKWKVTSSGRLHPDKSGRCSYKIEVQILPAAFYYVGGPSSPSGGYIKRGRELTKVCPVREDLS